MNRIEASNIPYIKIALIGDSGVGKSTLSSALATGSFETSPIYRPTIGCVIKVLSAIHELQGKYFIELWDLGGNPRFGDGRPIYYEDCDGYIFLWDSSSEVTYHSLEGWLAEVSQARESRSNDGERRSKLSDSLRESSGNNLDSDSYKLENGNSRTYSDAVEKESEESSSVPLLIVGNKIDKLNAHEKLALQNACPQQVFVSSRSVDEYDAAPFHKFFDEVYDKGRSRQVEGNEESSLPTATLTSTQSKVQDFKEKASPPAGDPVAAQASRHGSVISRPEIEERVTWTSPLRGFTSSLFSLSSASSLRYRIPHTPDHAHTHTHLPEKV